jgi:hypothetical protein
MDSTDSALSATIDSVKRRAVVTYSGLPTFSHWSRVLEGVLADPVCTDGFGILLDQRGISDLADSDCVTRMVQFIDSNQQVHGPTRWAILVSGAGAFGMGRMAEQLSNYRNAIRTFRTPLAAESWLGQLPKLDLADQWLESDMLARSA